MSARSKSTLPPKEFLMNPCPVTSVSLDDGGTRSQLAPVVLVPSAAGNSGHFTAQLAYLRPTRRAIAVDVHVRGTELSIDEAARRVLDELSVQGVQRFIAVGHSWGGAVAVAMAGEAPERILGLFLLDPASDGRQMPKTVAEGIMAALRSDAYLTVLTDYWRSMLVDARPAVRDRLIAEIQAAPRNAVIATLESLFHFDPLQQLSHYRGPRRAVITKLNDRPDALQRLAPDLPFEMVEGVGHWLHLDDPDRVNTMLSAFLEAVDGR